VLGLANPPHGMSLISINSSLQLFPPEAIYHPQSFPASLYFAPRFSFVPHYPSPCTGSKQSHCRTDGSEAPSPHHRIMSLYYDSSRKYHLSPNPIRDSPQGSRGSSIDSRASHDSRPSTRHSSCRSSGAGLGGSDRKVIDERERRYRVPDDGTFSSYETSHELINQFVK
jgi:hypothetical protein